MDDEIGLTEFKGRYSIKDISKNDIQICAAMWYSIMATVKGGVLSLEVLNDPDLYFGRYMMTLEQRIRSLGGKVEPMANIEIPK